MQKSKSRSPHSRRSFIKKSSAAVLVVPIAGLSGCSGSGLDRLLEFSTLAQGIAEAERLVNNEIMFGDSQFSLAQTLVHCAQSIEYSIDGFPESKSKLFQSTLGAAAFGVFSSRGKMSHDLTEGIPGAPSLASFENTEEAFARLIDSVERFENTKAPLKAHFAYGELTKNEYTLAHAFHLANHFSSFSA